VFCQEIKRQYATAAALYAGAFKAGVVPAEPLKSLLPWKAAGAAALAAAGQGAGAPSGEADRANLRKQARDWLTEELERWRREARDGGPVVLLELARALAAWRTDPALSAVRDDAALAKVPADEQKAWRHFWAEAETLTKAARARFEEVGQWKGLVTPASRETVHEVSLRAGKTYVFDMESRKLDSYLRVEDAKGRVLAEDDDSGGNLNARLVFTPAQDGTYRLVALSLRPRDAGYYTLTARALVPRVALPSTKR
jgi:hypothetical protein